MIESPCIGVCTIDRITGLCTGCDRSLDEIEAWGSMTADERKLLFLVLQKRRKKDAKTEEKQ
jgi:predicted Fe-S protein YdhL (DUF1289 family)